MLGRVSKFSSIGWRFCLPPAQLLLPDAAGHITPSISTVATAECLRLVSRPGAPDPVFQGPDLLSRSWARARIASTVVQLRQVVSFLTPVA